VLIFLFQETVVLNKSGLAEPETVHNVMMMLSQVRRRHADGVSDNNVDMTWRLCRWRDDVYGDDVDDLKLENKLDVLNVDHVTWRAVRDELDVLNVGSGYEPPWHRSWRDWPTWPRASTAAPIQMQIQTSMETVQSRPIPAKMIFLIFILMNLPWHYIVDSQHIWWYYNFALHYKNRQLFGIFNIKLEA
jgi:hypothetical protein